MNVINIQFDDKHDQVCRGCALGKQHPASFGKSESKPIAPGELVHTDFCGPIQKASIGGSLYFLLFKDGFSHFRKLFFINEKSEVGGLIDKFIKCAKTDGIIIKTIQSDNVSNIILCGITLRFRIH